MTVWRSIALSPSALIPGHVPGLGSSHATSTPNAWRLHASLQRPTAASGAGATAAHDPIRPPADPTHQRIKHRTILGGLLTESDRAAQKSSSPDCPRMSMRSVTSVRAARTNPSACAFAQGCGGGGLHTVAPCGLAGWFRIRPGWRLPRTCTQRVPTSITENMYRRRPGRVLEPTRSG